MNPVYTIHLHMLITLCVACVILGAGIVGTAIGATIGATMKQRPTSEGSKTHEVLLNDSIWQFAGKYEQGYDSGISGNSILPHEMQELQRHHPLLVRYLNERFNRIETQLRAIMDATLDLNTAVDNETTALGTVADDLGKLSTAQAASATALTNLTANTGSLKTEIAQIIGLLTPGTGSGDKPVDAATVEQAVAKLQSNLVKVNAVHDGLTNAAQAMSDSATATQGAADAIKDSTDTLTAAATPPASTPPTDGGTPPADGGTPPATPAT